MEVVTIFDKKKFGEDKYFFQPVEYAFGSCDYSKGVFTSTKGEKIDCLVNDDFIKSDKKRCYAFPKEVNKDLGKKLNTVFAEEDLKFENNDGLVGFGTYRKGDERIYLDWRTNKTMSLNNKSYVDLIKFDITRLVSELEQSLVDDEDTNGLSINSIKTLAYFSCLFEFIYGNKTIDGITYAEAKKVIDSKKLEAFLNKYLEIINKRSSKYRYDMVKFYDYEKKPAEKANNKKVLVVR